MCVVVGIQICFLGALLKNMDTVTIIHCSQNKGSTRPWSHCKFSSHLCHTSWMSASPVHSPVQTTSQNTTFSPSRYKPDGFFCSLNCSKLRTSHLIVGNLIENTFTREIQTAFDRQLCVSVNSFKQASVLTLTSLYGTQHPMHQTRESHQRTLFEVRGCDMIEQTEVVENSSP